MKNLFLLLFILPFCMSCNTGSDNSTDEIYGTESPLFPLTLGTYWDIFIVGAEGDEFEVTFEIVEIPEPNEYTIATDPMGYLYLSKSDIGYSVTMNDQSFLIKYPIKKNESYQYTDEKGYEFSITVTGTENISVEAGDFDCLIYKIELLNPEKFGGFDAKIVTFWASPGIGFIKYSDVWQKENVSEEINAVLKAVDIK